MRQQKGRLHKPYLGHINRCVCDFNGVLFETDAPSQVGESLSVLCVSGLVLDEDGTGVDTEGFFQALPENSVLMVLEKDQKWTPDTVRAYLALPSLTTRGHCWNYTKYLYKGRSSENRLGLNPALKYVLSWPDADLVYFFFLHQSSLQGPAPVWF